MGEQHDVEPGHGEADGHHLSSDIAARPHADDSSSVARDVRDATDWLARFAGAQTAILSLTLLFVGLTLWATRKTLAVTRDTLTEAKSATAATREAVEVARAGEAAYVLPVIDITVRAGIGGAVQVRIGAKNFGRTPARDVRATALLARFGGDMDRPGRTVSRGAKSLAMNDLLGTLGPNQEKLVHQRLVELREFDVTDIVDAEEHVAHGTMVVAMRMSYHTSFLPSEQTSEDALGFGPVHLALVHTALIEGEESSFVSTLNNVSDRFDFDAALGDLDRVQRVRLQQALAARRQTSHG